MEAKTKEILVFLIRSEFDSIDLKNDWICEKANDLIEVAKDLGFEDLVSELENDLKIETI
jgi:hypothetical protein